MPAPRPKLAHAPVRDTDGADTGTTAAMQVAADLRRRIDEASRYVPLENLSVSPQCGFASTAAGNPLTESDELAKLKLCVDVANAVWR